MKNGNQVLKGGTATLADCARLWATLTGDYIPGLKIELSVTHGDRDEPRVLLELVDYSSEHYPENMQRSVWSRREFFSPLYLISHTQLFDLLIVGYRVIDTYFATGKDNRPSPM